MLAPGVEITHNLRLVRRLRSGGMGTVWIAHHAGLDSAVVVKFVAAEHAGNPIALSRFRNEAAAASKVRSPHVVQMLDHGLTRDGLPYIAMELLEGEDLADRLDAVPRLPAGQVVTLVQQVARALSRAHACGVVHRDIKPANIYLANIGGSEAFLKVLDFGIAKSAMPSALDITNAGALVGTPHYMSPEQILGAREVSASSDLWALAVVAFEALTGQCPFDGENVGAVSVAICHGELPLPSRLRPDLPAAVDRWFLRACSRDPAQRFQSALEMASALERAVGVATPIPTDACATVLRELPSLIESEPQHTPTPHNALAVTPLEHRSVVARSPRTWRAAAGWWVAAALAGVLGAMTLVRATPSVSIVTEETARAAPPRHAARAKEISVESESAPSASVTAAPSVSASARAPVVAFTARARASAKTKSPWGDDWPE